ncbi:hypothetical protein V6N13_064043 [Hibiscus sabdariffa]|uniref:Uncharacterized protein n=1 Tax=Hibiscus sabdariffa TaxID=183260 RepID=A0ABR2R1W4_9ROSI
MQRCSFGGENAREFYFLAYLSLFPKDILTISSNSGWQMDFSKAPGKMAISAVKILVCSISRIYGQKGFVQDVEDRTSFYLFKIHDVSQEECLTIYTCSTLPNIDGMQNLTYCHQLEPLKFLINLETITIISCQKINLLMEPQGIEDQDLHLSLKNLIIRDAPNLRDLPRLLLQASVGNLEFIEIRDCANFEALPDWFQNLNSLQSLEIISCPKLSSLPDGLQHCPTLTDKCRPQTGADWSKISHIQEIHIEDQKIINSP